MAFNFRQALVGIGQSGAAQNIPALINTAVNFEEHQARMKALDFEMQQNQAKLLEANKVIPFDAALDSLNVPNDPEIRSEFLKKAKGTGLVDTINPPSQSVNLPTGNQPAVSAEPKYFIKQKNIEAFNKSVDQSHDFRENIFTMTAQSYERKAEEARSLIDNYKAKNPDADPKTDEKLAKLIASRDEYNKQSAKFYNKAVITGNMKELMKTYTPESVIANLQDNGKTPLIPIQKLSAENIGKTQDLISKKDGKAHTFGWNATTNRYDVDMGLAVHKTDSTKPALDEKDVLNQANKDYERYVAKLPFSQQSNPPLHLQDFIEVAREEVRKAINPEKRTVSDKPLTDDRFNGGGKPEPAPAQPQETKTLGGKTYLKINGKWYEK